MHACKHAAELCRARGERTILCGVHGRKKGCVARMINNRRECDEKFTADAFSYAALNLMSPCFIDDASFNVDFRKR